MNIVEQFEKAADTLRNINEKIQALDVNAGIAYQRSAAQQLTWPEKLTLAPNLFAFEAKLDSDHKLVHQAEEESPTVEQTHDSGLGV